MLWYPRAQIWQMWHLRAQIGQMWHMRAQIMWWHLRAQMWHVVASKGTYLTDVASEGTYLTCGGICVYRFDMWWHVCVQIWHVVASEGTYLTVVASEGTYLTDVVSEGRFDTKDIRQHWLPLGVTNCKIQDISSNEIFKRMNWMPFQDRVSYKRCLMMF